MAAAAVVMDAVAAIRDLIDCGGEYPTPPLFYRENFLALFSGD